MLRTLDGPARVSVLGAMKSVVDQPQAPSSLGAQLIAATSDVLFASPLDRAVADLPRIAPDQLAAALSGQAAGSRTAAELVALAAVVDGLADAARIELALDYADHLGVKDHWVDELREVAAGRMDAAMHLMVVVNAATFPGLAPAGREPELLPYNGVTDADKRLHERYEALESYPAGSFGRALWVHFRRHGFRFPGQEGAFTEKFTIPHDSIHVLSDYNTSIQGELLVSTYTGRMHVTDALAAHLLPVIFQWHIGQEVNGIGAQHGALDPWKFVVAWKRGDQTAGDVLSPDWDFFAAAPRQLDALREEYGIPALPEQYRPAGPEVNVTAEADPTVR